MELFLLPQNSFVDQEMSRGTVPSGFAEPVERILRSRINKSSVVLDASTSDGYHLEDLLNLSENVYVCEQPGNKPQINITVRQRVQVVSCDLSRLPFMDGAFDLVLLSDFHETPPSNLNEVFRILKPQGLLLCTISGPEIPTVETSGEQARLESDNSFYRSVAERTAMSLLEVSGFSVLHREFQLAPIPERIFLAQKGC